MTYIEIFVLLATIVGFVASWITIYEWAKNNLTAQQTADLGEFLSGHEEEERKREKVVVETVPPQNQQQQQTTAPAKEKPKQKHIHSENWADYFIQIFDSFFRPKGQFLISPWRSIIATTMGLILCAGLVTAVGGTEIWKQLSGRGVEDLFISVSMILVANYIGDWISLTESRELIAIFRKKSKHVTFFLLLVVFDYWFTLISPLLVGWIIASLSVTFYGSFGAITAMEVQKSFYWILGFPYFIIDECVLNPKKSEEYYDFWISVNGCRDPMLITAFMTTFITTFWFIMFAIATWVARGPMKWFRGSQAQTIKNPFAVLVIIFSVMSFLLLSLIPLSLLWR